VCLVFGNADSGEGYIIVDGNAGDRKNLTLWQGAEQVIPQVASHCNNTIVVLHTVGPVLVADWYDHPNITAILWAGLPGQESGNSLTDVLYGRVNPGGKTPFTWGKTLKNYGPQLVTQPNNGAGAPQIDYTEGVFTDYRAFDKADVQPIFEFGFGLSYTTFEFSELQVEAVVTSPYIPNEGMSTPAPSFGEPPSASGNLFPQGITRIPGYVYPWLNSTDLKASSRDPDYGLPSSAYIPPGATDSSPQPVAAAGGAPGGNPHLYDRVYEITAVITNTGNVVGDEVPQVVCFLMYGSNFPESSLTWKLSVCVSWRP
jgi:beta-glucosidase